jgi:hypothetical protein
VRAPFDEIVIDENGESWPAWSPTYASAVGYPKPDFDLVRYAVHNLGHVRVVNTRDSARIYFRPDGLSPVTLAGVFLAVFERAPRRIVLSWDGPEGWSNQVFGEIPLAFSRMEDLVGGELLAGSRFEAERYGLAKIDLKTRKAVEKLTSLWRERSGRWNDELPRALAGMEAGQTTCAARMPARSRRLVIEYSGAGYTFADGAWRGTLAAGHDFEDQPDRVYAEKAAGGYRRTAGCHEPRLERVSAIVATPGLPPRRTRYVRFLMPWSVSGGDRIVTSTGFVRSSSLLR